MRLDLHCAPSKRLSPLIDAMLGVFQFKYGLTLKAVSHVADMWLPDLPKKAIIGMCSPGHRLLLVYPLLILPPQN